jgi:hypothetical protein
MIKKWFKKNSPWCPLFGVIPFKFLGSDSLIKDPIKERCLRIIEEARELWNIYSPLDIPAFSYSWPKPEEIPYYPKGELLTARGIFWHVLDIFGASKIFNPEMDPDQIKDSEVLWHARDYGESFDGAKEVEDFKMLAIFSIYLAWDSLEGILTGEESLNSPAIHSNLLFAETFLSKANKKRGEWEKREISRKGGSAGKKEPAFNLLVEYAWQNSKRKTSLSMWEFLKKRLQETEVSGQNIIEGYDFVYEKKDNKITLYFNDKKKRPRDMGFRSFQNYVSDFKEELNKKSQ